MPTQIQVFDQRGPLCRAARGESPLRAIRPLLAPAGWLYGRIALLRRRAYKTGLLESWRLQAPVISVGNLTAGGAGKTPMVEFIARWALDQGRRPAVLSRGYGSPPDGDGRNDEVLQLEWRLPEVAQYPDPDRVASGRRAVSDGKDCLILDDGFQHRRLQRNLDIVLIDALDPFGGGRCLPAGTLREPPGVLRNADLIVITRADAASESEIDSLSAHLASLAPGKPLFQCSHAPRAVTAWPSGQAEPAGALSGRRVVLFCGIGNPEAFLRAVRKLGANVVEAHFFPDHFAYRHADLTLLGEACRRAEADLALTTEKDLVKIRDAWPSRKELRALRVEIAFHEGIDRFTRLLEDALR